MPRLPTGMLCSVPPKPASWLPSSRFSVLASLGTAMHPWALETGGHVPQGRSKIPPYSQSSLGGPLQPVLSMQAVKQPPSFLRCPPLPGCFLWDERGSIVSRRFQEGGTGSKVLSRAPKALGRWLRATPEAELQETLTRRSCGRLARVGTTTTITNHNTH